MTPRAMTPGPMTPQPATPRAAAPHAATPHPTTLPNPLWTRLGLAGMVLAVLLPLATLWHLLSTDTAATGPWASARGQTAALTVSAARLARLLRQGEHCSGNAAGAAAYAGDGPPPQVADPAAAGMARLADGLRACFQLDIGLEDIFIVWPPGQPPAPDALGIAGHAPFGAAGTDHRQHMAQDLRTGRTAYAQLADAVGGRSEGIDQIVSLDLQPAVQVVLRYRLGKVPLDATAPLAASRHALVTVAPGEWSRGVPLPGLPGLHLVPAGTTWLPEWLLQGNGLRWVMTGMTLALLLAGAALLYSRGRAQRLHQAQLERHQAQLDRQVKLQSDIEESVNVGLRVIDRQGRITLVNRAFCDMSGFDQAELVGQVPPYSFWPPQAVQERREQLDAIVAGAEQGNNYQATFLRPGDGGEWTAQVSARPLGSGEGWILACNDVTEARRVQDLRDELIREIDGQDVDSQSQAAALQLIHDLTSPTAACRSACNGAENFLNQGDLVQVREGLRFMRNAVDKIQHVINENEPLLKGEQPMEALSLCVLTRRALAAESTNLQRHNIRVSNQVPEDLPTLLGKRVSLTNVLSTLIANSVAAMALPDISLVNRRLTLESYFDEAGGTISIDVRDQGCGIEAQHLDKVGQRGFSTKADGHGLGLNKAIWLVKAWGGELYVLRSQRDGPDRGTTLRLVLPLKPPANRETETTAGPSDA